MASVSARSRERRIKGDIEFAGIFGNDADGAGSIAVVRILEDEVSGIIVKALGHVDEIAGVTQPSGADQFHLPDHAGINESRLGFENGAHDARTILHPVRHWLLCGTRRV